MFESISSSRVRRRSHDSDVSSRRRSSVVVGRFLSSALLPLAGPRTHCETEALTVLEQQFRLLMILDVPHLALRLVRQVHPNEVLVLSENDRQRRLHAPSGQEAVLDGALALEQVAQLGGADSEAQLRDWRVGTLKKLEPPSEAE